MWGTTAVPSKSHRRNTYFNPRPPCGGRHRAESVIVNCYNISIHVPRVGDDRPASFFWRQQYNFNPRPPCGGRRSPGFCRLYHLVISIHVPRVGDDAVRKGSFGLCIRFQSTSPVWGTTRRQGREPACNHFNPRPPCGGRLTPGSYPVIHGKFQSTSPVWGTTRYKGSFRKYGCHFNPRPPCGGRPDRVHLYSPIKHFNPRPPCGGRPTAPTNTVASSVFQSTSPVWGTTKINQHRPKAQPISIHVPRVGDDNARALDLFRNLHFNPRPPCGGRPYSGRFSGRAEAFQSTSPVWGTTFDLVPCGFLPLYFNPRPPCGGRLDEHNGGNAVKLISIHVPRVGDDPPPVPANAFNFVFQSTSPVWGTTPVYPQAVFWSLFQSTSPVWGTTSLSSAAAAFMSHFNPRPPCGGRRFCGKQGQRTVGFQSTSPVWGTTSAAAMPREVMIISIHVPRVGDDEISAVIIQKNWISIHVPRVGDDVETLVPIIMQIIISIHVPRVGDDDPQEAAGGTFTHFNPRPPCGGRPVDPPPLCAIRYFNPRPPCGGRRAIVTFSTS